MAGFTLTQHMNTNQTTLLWKRADPSQDSLIDFNSSSPPTHSQPLVLKGCFLTSEVVLHLCVKALRPRLRFKIYWLLYNVSGGSRAILCLAVGPHSGRRPCIPIAVSVEAVKDVAWGKLTFCVADWLRKLLSHNNPGIVGPPHCN